MRHASALVVLAAISTGAAAAQEAMPSHGPARQATAAVAPAPPTPVARVNGTPLMSDRFAMAVDAILPIASYHTNLTPAKMAEIREQAMQNLVDEELQYQEARRLKVTVSPRDVERGLARARAGYKKPKQFDEDRRSAGVPLSTLRREIRRALLIRQAYEHMVLARCQVTDAAAAEFYRDNPQRFVVPELHRVSLITIGVDPAAGTNGWTAAREKADQVLREARSGRSFEELARDYSTDPSRTKGGDIGEVHEGRMGEEFERALAPMKPGDISGIIQTLYGFHLVKLTGVRPPEQRTFEQVKATLRRDLQEKACASANDEWMKSLRAGARIEILESKPARTPRG